MAPLIPRLGACRSSRIAAITVVAVAAMAVPRASAETKGMADIAAAHEAEVADRAAAAAAPPPSNAQPFRADADGVLKFARPPTDGATFIPIGIAWNEDDIASSMVRLCNVDFALYHAAPSVMPMFEDLITTAGCRDVPPRRGSVRETTLGALEREYVERGCAAAAERGQLEPACAPTGVIIHESRCGSTLLSNMLASLPYTLVYSEVGPPNAIIRQYRLTFAERVHWLRVIYGAMTRPIAAAALLRRDGADPLGTAMHPPPSAAEEGGDADEAARQADARDWSPRYLFLKTQHTTSLDMAVYQAAFPRMAWIYLHRQPVEVMMSLLRDATNAPLPDGSPSDHLTLAHMNNLMNVPCMRSKADRPAFIALLANYTDKHVASKVVPTEDWCAADLAWVIAGAVRAASAARTEVLARAIAIARYRLEAGAQAGDAGTDGGTSAAVRALGRAAGRRLLAVAPPADAPAAAGAGSRVVPGADLLGRTQRQSGQAAADQRNPPPGLLGAEQQGQPPRVVAPEVTRKPAAAAGGNTRAALVEPDTTAPVAGGGEEAVEPVVADAVPDADAGPAAAAAGEAANDGAAADGDGASDGAADATTTTASLAPPLTVEEIDSLAGVDVGDGAAFADAMLRLVPDCVVVRDGMVLDADTESGSVLGVGTGVFVDYPSLPHVVPLLLDSHMRPLSAADRGAAGERCLADMPPLSARAAAEVRAAAYGASDDAVAADGSEGTVLAVTSLVRVLPSSRQQQPTRGNASGTQVPRLAVDGSPLGSYPNAIASPRAMFALTLPGARGDEDVPLPGASVLASYSEPDGTLIELSQEDVATMMVASAYYSKSRATVKQLAALKDVAGGIRAFSRTGAGRLRAPRAWTSIDEKGHYLADTEAKQTMAWPSLRMAAAQYLGGLRSYMLGFNVPFTSEEADEMEAAGAGDELPAPTVEEGEGEAAAAATPEPSPSPRPSPSSAPLPLDTSPSIRRYLSSPAFSAASLPLSSGLYPQLYPLRDILGEWNPDIVNPPGPVLTHAKFNSLRYFDARIPAQMAEAELYRRAELPFVVRNLAALDATVEAWERDSTLQAMMGARTYAVETSDTAHFLFYQRGAGGGATRDGTPPPTRTKVVAFPEWLSKAYDAAEEVVGAEVDQLPTWWDASEAQYRADMGAELTGTIAPSAVAGSAVAAQMARIRSLLSDDRAQIIAAAVTAGSEEGGDGMAGDGAATQAPPVQPQSRLPPAGQRRDRAAASGRKLLAIEDAAAPALPAEQAGASAPIANPAEARALADFGSAKKPASPARARASPKPGSGGLFTRRGDATVGGDDKKGAAPGPATQPKPAVGAGAPATASPRPLPPPLARMAGTRHVTLPAQVQLTGRLPRAFFDATAAAVQANASSLPPPILALLTSIDRWWPTTAASEPVKAIAVNMSLPAKDMAALAASQLVAGKGGGASDGGGDPVDALLQLLEFSPDVVDAYGLPSHRPMVEPLSRPSLTRQYLYVNSLMPAQGPPKPGDAGKTSSSSSGKGGRLGAMAARELDVPAPVSWMRRYMPFLFPPAELLSQESADSGTRSPGTPAAPGNAAPIPVRGAAAEVLDGEEVAADADVGDSRQPPITPATPSFFVPNPEAHQGVHCRFGVPGVIAEAHWDAGRNFIAMARGYKRYVLAPPDQCDNLWLLRDGPSARHSGVDWTDPDVIARKLAGARGLQVVLGPGDILYVPALWHHFVVSLTLSIQCNARSGTPPIGLDSLAACNFTLDATPGPEAEGAYTLPLANAAASARSTARVLPPLQYARLRPLTPASGSRGGAGGWTPDRHYNITPIDQLMPLHQRVPASHVLRVWEDLETLGEGHFFAPKQQSRPEPVRSADEAGADRDVVAAASTPSRAPTPSRKPSVAASVSATAPASVTATVTTSPPPTTARQPSPPVNGSGTAIRGGVASPLESPAGTPRPSTKPATPLNIVPVDPATVNENGGTGPGGMLDRDAGVTPLDRLFAPHPKDGEPHHDDGGAFGGIIGVPPTRTPPRPEPSHSATMTPRPTQRSNATSGDRSGRLGGARGGDSTIAPADSSGRRPSGEGLSGGLITIVFALSLIAIVGLLVVRRLPCVARRGAVGPNGAEASAGRGLLPAPPSAPLGFASGALATVTSLLRRGGKRDDDDAVLPELSEASGSGSGGVAGTAGRLPAAAAHGTFGASGWFHAGSEGGEGGSGADGGARHASRHGQGADAAAGDKPRAGAPAKRAVSGGWVWDEEDDNTLGSGDRGTKPISGWPDAGSSHHGAVIELGAAVEPASRSPPPSTRGKLGAARLASPDRRPATATTVASGIAVDGDRASVTSVAPLASSISNGGGSSSSGWDDGWHDDDGDGDDDVPAEPAAFPGLQATDSGVPAGARITSEAAPPAPAPSAAPVAVASNSAPDSGSGSGAGGAAGWDDGWEDE